MFILGAMRFLVQLWTELGLDHRVSFIQADREPLGSEPLVPRVLTLQAIHSPATEQPGSNSSPSLSLYYSRAVNFLLVLRRPGSSDRLP